MAAVACQVVRRVADELQPGLVEAQLTDSDGRSWSFIDKEPVFCPEEAVRAARLPVAAAIRCRIIRRDILADGQVVMTIDTAGPDGLDSDGVTVFRVPASSVSGG
jgi:hypothetical protein